MITRIKNKLKEIITKFQHHSVGFIDQIASLFPGPLGWTLRRALFRNRIQMGSNVAIDEHVCIKYPERLSIGMNSFIGRGCAVQASGCVEIGSDVIIGPHVKIWSSDHTFSRLDIPIHRQGHTFGKVVIKDDVWIGTSAIILKGVTIHHGSVCAAGSVINHDVPPYAVVAGNPARVIKYRNADKIEKK